MPPGSRSAGTRGRSASASAPAPSLGARSRALPRSSNAIQTNRDTLALAKAARPRFTRSVLRERVAAAALAQTDLHPFGLRQLPLHRPDVQEQPRRRSQSRCRPSADRRIGSGPPAGIVESSAPASRRRQPITANATPGPPERSCRHPTSDYGSGARSVTRHPATRSARAIRSTSAARSRLSSARRS